MMKILNDLKTYLASKSRNALPSLEMLDRMIERIESEGTDERELIIKALNTLEKVEDNQQLEALEYATRNRRKLKELLTAQWKQAYAKRDAKNILRLIEIQNILNEPPKTTRTMDVKSIELAVETLEVKKKHPNWSYRDIAEKHFDDIGEKDRIKKAVERFRRLSKSYNE